MTNKGRGELYRNTRQGKVAGVCAGIADYFGWEPWLVRILVVSGVLLGLEFFVVVYIAAWFILDKKPKTTSKQYANTQENNDNATQKTHQQRSQKSVFDDETVNESIKVKSRIWQAGEPPKKALRHISRKFGKLETELQMIECYVTSPEFTVSREINNL